jgi:hypothetical protein
VVNGSLNLAARAIVLQTFVYHLAKQDAAMEFSLCNDRLFGPEARAF